MKVAELRPYMLTDYLATKPHWKANTVRYAITRILAALNYCEKQGYIVANPLKGFPRPSVERREVIVSDAELGKLIEGAMPEFRDLLVCMRELGTRPKELFTAEIGRVDYERGVLMVGEQACPPDRGETPPRLPDRDRDGDPEAEVGGEGRRADLPEQARCGVGPLRRPAIHPSAPRPPGAGQARYPLFAPPPVDQSCNQHDEC